MRKRTVLSKSQDDVILMAAPQLLTQNQNSNMKVGASLLQCKLHQLGMHSISLTLRLQATYSIQLTM